MYLIFKVGAAVTGTNQYKVEAAWLSIDDPVDRMSDGFRYCQVSENDNDKVNRVLNDLANVRITLSSGTRCNSPTFIGTTPVDLIHTRKIEPSSWLATVRPAWHRAATASSFLNL